MPTIADQAGEIDRRRVLQARETSPLARMWEGPRLFDIACRITRADTAQQCGPAGAATEDQRRLRIAERLPF